MPPTKPISNPAKIGQIPNDHCEEIHTPKQIGAAISIPKPAISVGLMDFGPCFASFDEFMGRFYRGHFWPVCRIEPIETKIPGKICEFSGRKR
ncbi:MAG: hypothetical protein ACKO26_26580 [Planctomycetota bacterium]